MTYDDVEKARIACYEKKKKRACLFFIVVGLFVLFLLVLLFNDSGGTLIGNIFCIFFVFFSVFMIVLSFKSPNSFLSKNEWNYYRKCYKAYFVEKQLVNYLDDIKYSHELGLDRNILRETGMINTGDVFSSNDLTTGIYKGVKFMQADVLSKVERTDEKGNKYYLTIFKGRWMVFEFPKKFNFRMVLSHKKIPTYYKNIKTGKGLEVIKTESEEFNDRFVVQAEDEFEAFYILDPIFIENLERLGKQHDDNVSVYFCNNKMYIGINDGDDIFEPPDVKSKINEKAELKKVLSEMRVITDIVDNLRLAK